jgi:hypothetical protein
MDDILVEPGIFTHGVLSGGKYFTAFVLAEDTMLHTLMVSNDSSLDFRRLSGDEENDIPADESYYSACILAKRLQVEGVKQVTPEMIMGLSRQDGQLLLAKSALLEQRREEFRKAAAASPEGHPGPVEDGL